MKIRIIDETAKNFAKRAFYLAWQCCGGPMGMGIFQDNPGASEDDIWKNVSTAGDYPINTNGERLYGDYVFGRMMKWGCELNDNNELEVRDGEFRPDYQGFARIYPDNQALFKDVAASLQCKFEIIPPPPPQDRRTDDEV